jgi:ABC-type multidrug transport system ATPase subunit
MEIEALEIAKKFEHRYIIKDISIRIKSAEKWAILGNNGSGKSTLLKIISGYSTPSKGTIHWRLNNQEINRDNLPKYLSFASPLLSLPQEATVYECLSFQHSLKKLSVEPIDALNLLWLNEHKHKQVSKLSSGMQQRLKVGAAILQQTTLLFLDEPCTNLDASGVEWFNQMINDYALNKTIVVATNQPALEAAFAEKNFKI